MFLASLDPNLKSDLPKKFAIADNRNCRVWVSTTVPGLEKPITHAHFVALRSPRRSRIHCIEIESELMFRIAEMLDCIIGLYNTSPAPRTPIEFRACNQPQKSSPDIKTADSCSFVLWPSCRLVFGQFSVCVAKVHEDLETCSSS